MILIVTEKPSVARDIAAVVGAERKQDGHREGNGYLVSWCLGHLLEACQPEDYDPMLKKWKLDTLPIFPAPFRYNVQPKTRQQFEHLSELMNRSDVDSLICATDAGREGEHIFRLVYQAAGCSKPWKRLWTSSMEADAIRRALDTMQDGHDYDHLADAAQCRQEADWLIGMNLTRMYSVLYGTKLPTGRVQSPTLAMIVRRQQRIDEFKPTPYYIVTLRLSDRLNVQHRFDDPEEMKAFLSTAHNMALIRAVTHSTQRLAPPRLYNSAAIQQEANRLFGYTANDTLANLQGLYEEKLATYPRTDSRYITEDMEQPTRSLIAVMQDRGLLPLCEAVNVRRLVNSAKVNDHPALLPTASLTGERLEHLPTVQRNLATLLLYRLLEAGAGEQVVDAVTLEADVDGVLFTAQEKITLEPGWKQWRDACLTAVRIRPKDTAAPTITDLDEGDELPVTEMKQEKAMTKPPTPYTEAALLSAMETAGRRMDDVNLRDAMRGKGLGTAATRAGIIESLVKNGYVTRKGRYLLPTQKAATYISVLAEQLKDPELTAQWEVKLLAIEEGRGDAEQFIREIQQFLSGFVNGIKNGYTQELYEGVFSPSDRSGRQVIGTCPLCGGDVMEYQKAFSCSNYRSNGCRFAIWKEKAGKIITVKTAQSLLSHGKTRPMKGFKNRDGTAFEAALELIITDGTARVGFAGKGTERK